ncbi:FAD-dependent oxidoreductase [Aulosira sp. FACHB-615]|uniref:FAD-dependent oxidoreductase n=1 Tax=Aulosira sp. FACHB-615 TaxID=2692777 RepID=UPI0016860423|nr:FAD-dependent oxidoreductase [Aulosira sp. FACHB-615]MBD2492115.1 FAD-dependent oxidoreductase [Aulosira sp. FACHB-615]
MLKSKTQKIRLFKSEIWLVLVSLLLSNNPTNAAPPRNVDKIEACEILVVGGGLAGTSTAYEALLAGRTVCLTDITDWIGGQATSQGVSALDETSEQVDSGLFPRGYKKFREMLKQHYGKQNPGECQVSRSCFLPRDGEKILRVMLQQAAHQGGGKLKWYPNTVIKELNITSASEGSSRKLIKSAIAIQHQPQPNTPPLNTEPLSQTIEDTYSYENSSRFAKTIVQFVPAANKKPSANRSADWYVIEATETGELIALADVPYQIGIDARSLYNPSSASSSGDPYCTQGYTYTFAMQATKEAQTHTMPSFYPQYAGYYSYEKPHLASFPFVFAYRRIFKNPKQPKIQEKFGNLAFIKPMPGDISMQNWTWGNDYRPGTANDNLILSRDQIRQTRQLQPGQWMGGLRVESLRKAEEVSQGFFYWLVEGTTDSRLGDGVKQADRNHRYLRGLDSPMGTVHGLSKYPYIREARRIIGRPARGYAGGFSIQEIDISQKNFTDSYYRQTLGDRTYRNLAIALGNTDAIARIQNNAIPTQVQRTRSRIYPDAVGIGHYNIDFHPCMVSSPPEQQGNSERQGMRQAESQTYPFQIPLRAMIPQQIDNLIVAGKSIATSQIASAAYRVHAYEWSSGAAAGTVANFALEEGILPYQLIDQLPQPEKELETLQQRLRQNQNPIIFPSVSILNKK